MSVVTVVTQDKKMIIDGDPMTFDLGLDDNVWAIQWDGSKGHIEYNDGTPNKDITEFPELESLTAKHTQAKIDAEADEKKRLEARTWEEKRKEDYPAIEDQLDDIYHNGIDGWKATIKVTKDKYPKE
jgi:hypothetical protein|tara:strand:- start:51 stop:431 length:381 start_codon:yes stop_codon:yes gene_type:complete